MLRLFRRVSGACLGLALVLLAGCAATPPPAASGTSPQPAQPKPATPPAPAPAAREQFRGKTINFVVPFQAGGGFDVVARLLAPTMEKFTGSTVVVRNEPGAGTLIATNNLFKNKGDDKRLGLLFGPAVVSAQLAGDPAVQYDARQFSWLGRFGTEPRLLALGKHVPINSVADLRAYKGRPLKLGSTSAPLTLELLLVQHGFNVPVEVVTGFDGIPEILLAIQQGVLDGTASAIQALVPTLQSGAIKPIFFYNAADPMYSQVPVVTNLDLPADAKALFMAQAQAVELHRVIAAPPGLEQSSLAFLQEAIRGTLNDPDTVAKAKAAKFIIGYKTPAEVTTMVNGVINSPQDYKELIVQSNKR